MTESKDYGHVRYYDHSSDTPAEQIIADFQARQASPAYQEMLVSLFRQRTLAQDGNALVPRNNATSSPWLTTSKISCRYWKCPRYLY